MASGVTAIKTAGDLRGFLAEVLVGIRQRKVGVEEAKAIAMVSAQINQSLSTEVNTCLALERMGKNAPVAGTMMIGDAPALPEAPAIPHEPHTSLLEGGGTWCDQCEMRVAPATAATCKSKHCKVRPDAADA